MATRNRQSSSFIGGSTESPQSFSWARPILSAEFARPGRSMTSLAIHVELATKSIAVAELRHDRFGHRELGPLRLYPFLGAVC